MSASGSPSIPWESQPGAGAPDARTFWGRTRPGALRGHNPFPLLPPRAIPGKQSRRSSPRSQRVSAKGTWKTSLGVPRTVTLGGARAPECERRLAERRHRRPRGPPGAGGPPPGARSSSPPATRVSGSPAPLAPIAAPPPVRPQVSPNFSAGPPGRPARR